MPKVKRVLGVVLAIAGYLLSPLSWWNDLFINLPLAYFFAFLVGIVLPGYFLASMIAGYWITNVAGFMIMHAGMELAYSKEVKVRYLRDFLISLSYTVVVIIFYRIGWLKFPL